MEKIQKLPLCDGKKLQITTLIENYDNLNVNYKFIMNIQQSTSTTRKALKQMEVLFTVKVFAFEWCRC